MNFNRINRANIERIKELKFNIPSYENQKKSTLIISLKEIYNKNSVDVNPFF